MLIHANYDYPSHLIPILEVATFVVLLLVLVTAGPLGRRLWGGLRSACRRPRTAGTVVVLGTTLAGALTFAVIGAPVPRVHDEWSYLLAADTFAGGRLSNPRHPHWEHFETVHVIQEPTYASKYPPAQGLVLALGQSIAGHPAVGLWLATALFGAAVAWMLFAWLPPPWALLGTALLMLRVGIGSYWGQTYWGGLVAATGGALVWGGVRRVMKEPGPGPAVAMAAGVLVLANSRPYEGLLASLPAAVVMVAWALGKGPSIRSMTRRLAPGVLVLLAGLAWTGYYDWRVTGDPLVPPYRVHEATYNPRPLFIWQPPRAVPEYRHEALERFWRRFAGQTESATPWPLLAASRAPARIASTAYLVLGVGLAIGAVLVLGALRDRWLALAALTTALVLGSHAVTYSYWPHYDAPVAGLLVVLALEGLRRLQVVRWRTVRLGPAIALATFGTTIVVAAVQLPAQRPATGDWSRARRAIEDELVSTGQRHLVVVPQRTGTAGEWVYNRADIDAAPVVWARDMGSVANQELVEYFAGRTVWWLRPGTAEQSPALVSYEDRDASGAGESPRP